MTFGTQTVVEGVDAFHFRGRSRSEASVYNEDNEVLSHFNAPSWGNCNVEIDAEQYGTRSAHLTAHGLDVDVTLHQGQGSLGEPEEVERATVQWHSPRTLTRYATPPYGPTTG